MTTDRERHLRERLALQEALLIRQADRSLRAFIEQAWPLLEPATPFLPSWHIDLIAEYLEAVTAGAITRLVINIPPRYGKSLIVSVCWPAWPRPSSNNISRRPAELTYSEPRTCPPALASCWSLSF